MLGWLWVLTISSEVGIPNSVSAEESVFAVKTSARTEGGRQLAQGRFDVIPTAKSLTLRSWGTSGLAKEPATMYMLQAFLTIPTRSILQFPCHPGQAWTDTGEWDLKAEVEIARSETVALEGVVYANCIRHVTLISNTQKSEADNGFVNGSRVLWFAPGVGLVKMAYRHQNGTVTTAQLVSHHLQQPDSGLWPLHLHNTWTYRWQSAYREEPVWETWTMMDPRDMTSKREGEARSVPLASAEYTVTVLEGARRQATVRCVLIPASHGRGVIDLYLNKSHAQNLSDGFAHYIHDLTAVGSDELKLKIDRKEPARWQIHGPRSGPICFQYTVVLNHDNDDWRYGPDEAPYLREDCVFWSASALFVAPRAEPKQLSVVFDVPDSWQVSTAWQPGDTDKVFELTGTEELTETYLAMGTYRSDLARSGDTEVLLAVGSDMENPEGILFSTVDAFLKAYTGIFNGAPDRRVLIVANRNLNRRGMDGGVFGSSVSMLFPNPLSKANRSRWAPFVGHELFHIWSGQAFTYDRQEYWFSEGFTDYYCQVVSVRLGLITRASFVRDLREACRRYLSKQGNMSLQQAGENKSSQYDLVYQGGKLVAAVLDTEIRHTTGNRFDLDDLMSRMYRQFGLTQTRYTQRDILTILRELTDRDFQEFFDRYINGTECLPLQGTFAKAGLDYAVTVEEALPTLDFVVFKILKIKSLSHDRMLIKRSEAAGYQDGDCLVAIDDRPIQSPRDLQLMARESQPGQQVQLRLKRQGSIITMPLTLGGQGSEMPIERKVSVRLNPMEHPTEQQQRIFDGMIGKKKAL